jgi:Transposase IS116/IS110/IS902 family
MWRDRDPYRDHQYVPDTFWLVVAVVLFAACGLIWLIGQVAAILFGAHQHLPVRLVDMLGVLLRLPGTWDNPARAWPPSSQPLLPGPVGMYAAAILTFWLPAFAYGLLAGGLVADVRQLEQRIAAVEARIKAAVARANTSLVGLFGMGPVLAATFLGEVGDVGRFPTKHHFAAHTGTAPLEASSGQVVRHRLSRAGDRKLNHALYMMAMVQVCRPSAGQAYYRRKLAEGTSAKEALRCLKRRLSDTVYRCLVADQRLAVAAG